MNCNCNTTVSQGICDNEQGLNILATRIFDNVRIALDRTELILVTNCNLENVSLLYAGGTGSFIAENNISITPQFDKNYAAVTGTLELNGNMTYIEEGVRRTMPCNLLVPVNLQMTLPRESLWPFDFTVHYSYFADNIALIDENRYSSFVDGVIMNYITACVPISINSFSPIKYNEANQRTLVSNNNFIMSAFYPHGD